MSYCDLCHCYDDEHTDGEPDMQMGRYYKPSRDFLYSKEIMGEEYCKYDWGTKKNWQGDTITCMCDSCFKSLDRLGQIVWRKND